MGWEKPAKLDLQSHIGELLRQQVDPLPPYIADMRELEGKSIGVIRVFPSSDAPHIVRGTGAIYVRTSKSKEPVPVDDHQTVLAMARRGEEAEVEARRRLEGTPAVLWALEPRDSWDRPREFVGTQFIARAAPLTVTPALSEWPLRKVAWERCSEIASQLLPPFGVSGFQYRREGPTPRPFGRAIAAEVLQERGAQAIDEAVVIADSAGVVAAGVRRGAARDDRVSLLVNQILEAELLPLAKALADLLHAAEAYGRVAVDVSVLLSEPKKKENLDEDEAEADPDEPRPPLHVARGLTVPADEDEVIELARQWHREIQRAWGIVKFEGEPE